MVKYLAKIISVTLGVGIITMLSLSQNISGAENHKTVYTIQVSSHQPQDLPKAIEIARRLQEKNFSDVRVELIGQLYAVRLGMYQKEKETWPVFQEIKQEFPDSFVRTGYYLPERIVYPEKNTKPVTEEKNDTGAFLALSEKQTSQPAVIPQTSEIQANMPVSKKEELTEPVTFLLASDTPTPSPAPETSKGEATTESKSPEEKKNSLELRFSSDYLAPHQDYGSWNQVSVVYSRKEKGFTYLVQGEGFWRQEGSGGLIGFGLYKDWKNTMYTYTSISAGSGVDYLPVIRIDHSFNFKVGRKRNIILPLGITYVRSPSEHHDYVFSTGAVVYLSKSVWEYKVSWNYNQPGSVSSYSNLISVSWGQEGVQWWHLTCSYGQEAYLADYLLIPEEVRNDALTLELGLRKWLKKNYGITANIGYFNLKGSYKKYGLSLGLFTEF